MASTHPRQVRLSSNAWPKDAGHKLGRAEQQGAQYKLQKFVNDFTLPAGVLQVCSWSLLENCGAALSNGCVFQVDIRASMARKQHERHSQRRGHGRSYLKFCF